MKRSGLWLVGLVLLVILAACGGGEEEGVTLKPVDTIYENAAQAASAGGLVDTFEGLMVFVKGGGLYYYDPASGQDPVFVTDELDPWTLTAAPSRDKLLFETGNYGDGQIHAFDVVTKDLRAIPVQLSHRAAQTWGVTSWSPDEQWALTLLWPIGQEAVRLDGEASYIVAESSDPLVTWLADGSVLIVDRDFAGFGGGSVVYRGVSRLDVTTGQTETWETDPDVLAQDLGAALQMLLIEHGQALADPDSVWGGDVNIIPPENFFSFQAAAPLCESWIFARNEPLAEGDTPNVLFESEQTYRITDFQVLDDGSWLYLKWTLPDCRISALPVIALVHQTPDGEPRTLTDNLFSEIDYSRRALNLGGTGRVALSPDQRRILWAGGNAEAGESTLNLTDLATGETQIVLTEQRGTLSPEAFAANQMIRAAYWLVP